MALSTLILFCHHHHHPGFPWWLSGKEFALQCRRQGFDPWVRKIHWRRKWQPIPVLLPGKSHGQKSLAGCSPWGSQRIGHDWACTHHHHSSSGLFHVPQRTTSLMWPIRSLHTTSCPIPFWQTEKNQVNWQWALLSKGKTEKEPIIISLGTILSHPSN